MELSIFPNFFEGFGYAAIFPFVAGVFVGIKRALYSSI